MPRSQRLLSVIPFVAIERPACPKCNAPMMLVSIELARPGVDLHTFECAICIACIDARYASPFLTHARNARPRSESGFSIAAVVGPACSSFVQTSGVAHEETF